jgi:toxin-antitoxin system PIN domain toxin
MKPALLDVNLLLAIHDRRHTHHRLAVNWFRSNIEFGWSTCAITQNGFVRVVSQPTYPNPLTTTAAARTLQAATQHPAHQFWPCDTELVDPSQIDTNFLLGPKQVTDAYLLALATRHAGRFATFDQRVDLRVVPAATVSNLVLVTAEN